MTSLIERLQECDPTRLLAGQLRDLSFEIKEELSRMGILYWDGNHYHSNCKAITGCSPLRCLSGARAFLDYALRKSPGYEIITKTNKTERQVLHRVRVSIFYASGALNVDASLNEAVSHTDLRVAHVIAALKVAGEGA